MEKELDNMRHMPAYLAIAMTLTFGVWLSTASVLASTRIVVKCLDLVTNKELACKVSVPPSSPQQEEGTSIDLDLIDPTVTVDIALADYMTRQIEVSTALKSGQTDRLTVHLARELSPEKIATLAVVNQLKKLVSLRQIDKAIALAEQIESRSSDFGDGTFPTRFSYWRMAAHFNGCTTLFYSESCRVARSAIRELRVDMEKRPEDFEREQITSKDLDRYEFDLDIADFIKIMATANWFNAKGDLTSANQQYLAAKSSYEQGSAAFRKETKVSSEGLDKDIASVQERIKSAATIPTKEKS